VVEPGTYRYPKMDGIVFGRPWTEVLCELVARLGARRIFVLASASLAARAALGDTLAARLGAALAALHVGIRAHTPRDDVIAAAAAARAANADLIVTIGGSSVTDAGKMLQLCLAADIRAAAAFDPWRAALRPLLPALAVRMVSIPTTLSGAEFTALAGCTDLQRRVKEAFAHPEMIPHTVILDPQITLHTPMPLWLSSGLRAVDHAVDTLSHCLRPRPAAPWRCSHTVCRSPSAIPRIWTQGLRASSASGSHSSARKPALPWAQATASDMRSAVPPAFLMG
jgi:maleylacetate reductase